MKVFRKQKRALEGALFSKSQMARVTRLELAASAVTGRRSNQLSYTRASEVSFNIKVSPSVSTPFLSF